MRIILLEDVKKLGRQYEVKSVADGYARNYLFPKHLAKPATAKALAQLEKDIARLARETVTVKRHLEEVARKLSERTLEFTLKTDATGSVFGSVNKDAILKALRSTGLVTKERVSIALDHPIKEFGEHTIAVNLKKGITADLTIIVRPQT